MARILFGIPCYDKVAPEVLEDYMRFAFYLGRRYPEHEFVLGIKTKSEQFRARNAIIEGAYQMGCEYVLMMDDDHIINWNTVNYASESYDFLHKLLYHMEQDPKLGLIGVLYYHRGGQCKPVLLKKIEGENQFRYLTDDEITHDYQEVDIQGGGCMLIRMKAMDFIGAPWFTPEIEFGTDFQICTKMKKAGFKVACDSSIEIGHLASERKIITSRNRHIIQADANATAKDLDVSTKLLPIYKEFKEEIMEYLSLQNETELIALSEQYKPHRNSFGNYAVLDDYYRNAKGYLARAAKLARLDEAWPSCHDDFLLRTMRIGVAAIGVDFGCGAGRLSFEFARGGHLMHFIDLDGVETFEFLKWRCQKHKVVAKFNIWPEKNTADYVLASDAIEHLENFDPLYPMVECLKPGGVLITNYLLMLDWSNPEHINNDKPQFLAILKSLGMVTVNSCVFQKIEPTP